MKRQNLKFFAAALIPVIASCSSINNSNSASAADSTQLATSSDSTGLASSAAGGSSYLNLSTGQSLSISRDSVAAAGAGNGSNGQTSGSGPASSYYYSDNRQPLESDLLFVDLNTRDTLYGPTGTIVNGAVIKSGDSWKLDETKVEREGNKVTVKNEASKIKIQDEEMKVKTGDTKVKVDGEKSKVKTPTTKEKTSETGEKKIKPQ